MHSGHHDDCEDPPNILLIIGDRKKKSSEEGVADVFAGVVSAIVTAINNPPKEKS